MKTTFAIKLPTWTTSGRTVSNQLPAGHKYPISYADTENLQWRGGSVLRQFISGYHFHMELREWDLKKALRVEITLSVPVLVLFFGFKGQLQSIHRQSQTEISLLSEQYGLINVPAGRYSLTVEKGQTVSFLYYIDPQFLLWLKIHDKGFLFPADQGKNAQEYYKFPFCSIDYNVIRIIRQLKTLSKDPHPITLALSEKLVSLLTEYQKQLNSLDHKLYETTITKVERIIQFIEREISKKPLPSVPEISRKFGIGHRTLRRLFKKHTGQSLNDFMHHARMKEGLRRLKKERTVTEVSQHLGYASVAAFSKGFTKYHGFPPESINKS